MTTTYAPLTALAIVELQRIDPALLPDDVEPGNWPERAAMDDALKRRVLVHALERGGPEVLLKIGLAVPRLTFLPAVRVLMASADTDVLAQKWMRLETYFHSSHRTRIDHAKDRAWHCTHYAISGPGPTAGEHLLICGVLAGVLAAFGVLDVKIGKRPDSRGRWLLNWTHRVEAPPPLRWLPGERADAQVARMIAMDPARAWTLPSVALMLGTSSRSLQRSLASAGTRFATLLKASRTAVASEMLLASADSLADVGYAAGFSDQAHFQRSFRSVIGMTPTIFRQLRGSRGATSNPERQG